MIDFHGYLLDPTEIVCVTPMRKDSTGWQFFAMYFRGGGTETFTGDTGHRDEFISLVKNARLDHGIHRMADFNGYLIDPGEIVCVTSMREGYRGPKLWRFFVVHFQGGSAQSFAKGQDKFVSLVRNAMLDQAMRQDTKRRNADERH
jgi:hypothetical protein